jgi:hypothetical protein
MVGEKTCVGLSKGQGEGSFGVKEKRSYFLTQR